MFDPTVFENLKVVLEGAVYDLDLSGRIRITAREDLIDLSSMSRCYAIHFKVAQVPAAAVMAEIRLQADLADLAGEILETRQRLPGCRLDVFFEEEVGEESSIDAVCRRTEALLKELWGEQYTLRQTISTIYRSQPVARKNRTQLDFGRKFGEDMIEDIPELLEHVMKSLRLLADSPV